MILHRFLGDTRASAAAEFALLLPMLIILLFGGTEAGHFVWSQHKLAEAVRDGARYAARLPIDKVCNETVDLLDKNNPSTEYDQVVLITRTGQLDDAAARPVVPGWTDAQVVVEVDCDSDSFVDTGIYKELGFRGPVVTVRAVEVTYPSMFNGLGLDGRLSRNVELYAVSHAAVIGI